MSKIKNLFLPGTSKNIGYILGNTMHIYDRYIKYFPVDTTKNYLGFGIATGKNFIVEMDSQYSELERHAGWYYEIEEKTYTFFDCKFKTPDNLDVVEMTYLYKNWNVRKKDGRKK